MTISEIKKMNVSEKLQAMENLWDSLISDDSEIESPAWHEELLAARKKKIESGKAKFKTLAELKNTYL